ncbi:MAG: FAD-dependent oxidoreductase, partial [Leptospirillia bacterium]
TGRAKKRLGPQAILAGRQEEKAFSFRTAINCAGLYADRIARDFGFSRDTTILPFKGIYLEYEPRAGEAPPVRTNIYPVPDLGHPFLGVHFTIKVDGTVKIGPTAIPAFWRENYGGLSRFDLREAGEILGWESSLFRDFSSSPSLLPLSYHQREPCPSFRAGPLTRARRSRRGRGRSDPAGSPPHPRHT